MKIHDIKLEVIQDSRGKDTLRAEMHLHKDGGIVSVHASVPSGKSTGAHEAHVVEPHAAIAGAEHVIHELLQREFADQREFDGALLAYDGTENKEKLGGNLTLALSLAFARLKAKEEGKELYRYIRDISGLNLGDDLRFPHPVFNVINGGLHANNNLDFQEFQIIPTVDGFEEAYAIGREYYEKLREAVEARFGKEQVTLGDEAGFSAPFQSNEEAIAMLHGLIEQGEYPVRIGLDVAATSYHKDDGYAVDGKMRTPEELRGIYKDLIGEYGIWSIEDPFEEESFGEFATLGDVLRGEGRDTIVITDDLTTTNPKRLQMAIDAKSGNAILVKLNQIGTLSETLEVIRLAYANGWKAIVSHRSGETMDDFIADLAVGVNAWGLKSGAPGKPERTAKYDRVLEIAKQMK